MDNYLKDYNDKIKEGEKKLLILKDSPRKTEDFVNKIVSENFEQLLYLTHNMNHDDALMNRNSSSDSDNHYLQALCLNAKPKKILEIGTWCGKSSYYMAAASDCPIHTVDDNDEFCLVDGYKEYSDRINRNPNTHSLEFWPKNKEKDFDFIFVDGFINAKDAENIFEITKDNFWFATHDYYDHNLDRCKGFDAIREMAFFAQTSKKYKYTFYAPHREWIAKGIPIHNDFGFGSLNTCIAVMYIEKDTQMGFSF